MLHVLYGNDINNRKKALDTIVDKAKSKGEQIFSFSDTDMDIGTVDSILSGSNLFGEKSLLVLHSTIEDDNWSQFIISKLDHMVSSPNTVAIVETEIKKSTLKDLEKSGATLKSFVQKSYEKKMPAVFELTDTFSIRDKKKTWLCFRKLRDGGVSADEIVPILFWSIKSALIVASQTKLDVSVESTGLSPFVYKKSLAMTKKFSYEELTGYLSRLNKIYHEARSGKGELDQSLELFILQAF